MINHKKPFKDSFSKDHQKTYDPVQVKVNGATIVQYVERVEDVNKGLHCSDFSIQSLMDAGATNLLTPIAPISRGVLNSSDNLVANSSAFADAITEKTNE